MSATSKQFIGRPLSCIITVPFHKRETNSNVRYAAQQRVCFSYHGLLFRGLRGEDERRDERGERDIDIYLEV
jgi:hypothetical protein